MTRRRQTEGDQPVLSTSYRVQLSATVRWGLARGVFSNDAGLGLQAILHSQAEGIDHPAQQGMWAVFETFVDTIVYEPWILSSC